MKANKWVGLLFLVSVVGCNSSNEKRSGKITSEDRPKVSPKEYVKWNTENKVESTKELNDLDFSLTYVPNEWLILRQSGKELDSAVFRSELKEQEGVICLLFKVSSKESKDILMRNKNILTDYGQLVDYFSFRIQNDMYLVSDSDTLPCMMSHWERTYGISSSLTMVVEFEKPTNVKKEEIQDLKFIYDDKVLGVGPVKLIIDKEKLSEIPVPII